MSMPTRRECIRVAGATALGLGAISSTGVADHYEGKPEHVTLTYDVETLERYRPELDIPSTEQDKLLGLYGWVATSPEYETGCCVYWASYSHQDGWIGNLDSHYGDHEPVYVFWDQDTEEVTEVVASVYHWLAGRSSPATMPMSETHPRLGVISPWHQYTAADSAGTYYDVEDLTSVFQSWLDNGLEEALEPGVVTEPWTMQSRDHWWRETGKLVNTDRIIVEALRPFSDDVGSLDE